MADDLQLLQQGYDFWRNGKSRRATDICRRLLEKNPYHKGALDLFRQMVEDAASQAKDGLKGVRSFERAFWLGNYYMGAHNNVLAERYYQEAVALQPRHFGALRNYAGVSHALGKRDLSAELNNRAFALNPHYEVLIEMAFGLPMVYDSYQEIETVRQQFIQNIGALSREDIRLSRPMERLTSWPGFFLAYQGRNDREIQKSIDAFFRQALIHEPFVDHPDHDKLRIGFLSRHFCEQHTIGKLTRGLIERLPRDRFDVTLFYLDDNYDNNPLAHEVIAEDARHVRLPYRELYNSARLISEKQLDALIYTDIGMDPCSYLLAQFRLARIQCAFWGHPVTTGIDTMDYYVSSRLIEPDDCAAHYSENLVLMDTLPCYYHRPNLETDASKTRADFGFSDDQHLYLCPQSIFKIHPDFDAVLEEILARDPQGRILLLKDASQYNNDKLMARLRRSMPEHHDRVVWVGRQTLQNFLSLMRVSDVMLDPLHFGGGNTTYEAIAMGIPIVTWPGEYMRGRVTYGCYQKIGMTETIAYTLDEYAPLAVAIASNPDLRAALREKTLARHHALYEDEGAVDEFAEFLEQAIPRAGARDHQTLPGRAPHPLTQFQEALTAHG
ncbi:MAG: hypothetical protein IPK79_04210 [Vampirovibrionales bacterium]|nr:hypothetical protein [Vampirovibrionales bacterium]